MALVQRSCSVRRRPARCRSSSLGYQKTALRRRSSWPRSAYPIARLTPWRAYKVSKRYDHISAVFACFALTLDGGRIASARIGCGVSPHPTRPATEAVLAGQPWNDATVDAAVRTLANEFTPIDDMRASAAYRRAALANLMRRFRLETWHAFNRVEQL
jgi:xanthine dehydrogenase small subunit